MRHLKHYLVVSVLVLLVTYLTYQGLVAANLFPAQASAQAVQIDWLFNLHIELISFFFALIMVPLVYSLVVFTRQPGDKTDAEHVEGNTALEIGWTIVPLIIVIWLGYIGADNLAQVEAKQENPVVINVVGFQWGWRFDYPQDFSSNTLYLPVGKPVLLRMESPDVLHSFWVPEFRIKQDLVPGRVTTYRITPIKEGKYKVRCAELCGKSHAYMEAEVIVVPQAEFDAWVKAESLKAAADAAEALKNPDAKRGEKLYVSLGCKACHSIDGSKNVGPTWKELFGHEVELADGTKVIADEAYITSSILNPAEQTVAGFTAGAMPNSFSKLKPGQIADLIEFIKSLK